MARFHSSYAWWHRKPIKVTLDGVESNVVPNAMTTGDLERVPHYDYFDSLDPEFLNEKGDERDEAVNDRYCKDDDFQEKIDNAILEEIFMEDGRCSDDYDWEVEEEVEYY